MIWVWLVRNCSGTMSEKEVELPMDTKSQQNDKDDDEDC